MAPGRVGNSAIGTWDARVLSRRLNSSRPLATRCIAPVLWKRTAIWCVTPLLEAGVAIAFAGLEAAFAGGASTTALSSTAAPGQTPGRAKHTFPAWRQTYRSA